MSLDGIVPYVLAQLVYALPALIGLFLIGAMARGAAGVLGVIGCVILLIGHALSAIWSIMLPRIIEEFDLPLSMASIPSAIIGLVSAIGLMMVVIAVVAGRRKPTTLGPQPPRPQGPPPGSPQYAQQPYGQQYPPQQPGPQQYGQQQPGPYQPGPPPPGR